MTSSRRLRGVADTACLESKPTGTLTMLPRTRERLNALSFSLGAIARRYLPRWAPPARQILIVGAGKLSLRLLEHADRSNDAFTVVAAFDIHDPGTVLKPGIHALRDFDEVIGWTRARKYTELWLALPLADEVEIRRYVMALRNQLVTIRCFPDVGDLPLFNHSIARVAGLPAINLIASPTRGDAPMKWIFDRIFSLFALALLAPLLLSIALAVKCTSPGPIFFRQRRKGIDGTEFTILKFARCKCTPSRRVR
jgi:putative colanic acid biosynthesis UDP-glucose lipid carrier transferase